MIRKLSVQDNDKLMEYLKEEASMNLFIIGDIENFGYDKDFMDLWGDFDDNGNYRGVLLRYYNSVIIYAKGDFDVFGFADIMKGFECVEVISGKGGVTEKFENIPGLKLGERRPTYLCELKDSSSLAAISDVSKVKKAGVNDVDRIMELWSITSEFSPVTGSTRRSTKNKLETKSGRVFYIEENGKIISSASTTAENSVSAMIVGVSTHPNHRNKGYATLCMNVLCRELLSEGRLLCLFYDNPVAGKIYKSLGFRDIGIWNMHKN
ncbi:acetyltransferase (GNAT) family protein [Oxobacter pfennigii]|uniref:Acetyltransferase (GNAT) family protein n=1 Tax=Oxobacter pfennigii TaxID=36849 RepID=A0A0N8NSW4_9CLOT|nr:GNAT family N-acetyltransferase [Oxobacter pfennigii]KPU43160.1 acetyltransferase (GNAT) family protein [Oxobacter pfennigii]